MKNSSRTSILISQGNAYTVAKMQLLSTNFKRVDGKFVWIGHNILATKVIENGKSGCRQLEDTQ